MLKRQLMYVCRIGSPKAVPLTTSTTFSEGAQACLVLVNGAYVVGVEGGFTDANPEVIKKGPFYLNVQGMLRICGTIDNYEKCFLGTSVKGFFSQLVTGSYGNLSALRDGMAQIDGIERNLLMPVRNLNTTALVEDSLISNSTTPCVSVSPLCGFPADIAEKMVESVETHVTVGGSRFFSLGTMRKMGHCTGRESDKFADLQVNGCRDVTVFDASPVSIGVREVVNLAVVCSGGSGPISIRRKGKYAHAFLCEWYRLEAKQSVYVCSFSTAQIGEYEVSWSGMQDAFIVGLEPRDFGAPQLHLPIFSSLLYKHRASSYYDGDCEIYVASVLQPTTILYGTVRRRVVRGYAGLGSLTELPFKMRRGYLTAYDYGGILCLSVQDTCNGGPSVVLFSDFIIGISRALKSKKWHTYAVFSSGGPSSDIIIAFIQKLFMHYPDLMNTYYYVGDQAKEAYYATYHHRSDDLPCVRAPSQLR